MNQANTTPLLTETDAAQDWIAQFLPEDRRTALTLLEKLNLVGRDEFERDLVEEVGAFMQDAERPVAMFVVRELEKSAGEVKEVIPYFSGDGPKAVSAPYGVGSEGDLAHLVRDLNRKYKILDHPGIEEMRSLRVRNIVVLNDSAGSGYQVRRFIKESIYDQPTIKSWTSSGKVKLTSIVHSSTRTGSAYIMKGNSHWSLRSSKLFGDITDGIDQNLALRLKELCIRYGKESGIPKNWILGYKNTFSGVIFPHKCPNSVPGILWYNGNGQIKPLFSQRGSFDFPVWPISITPQKQLRRIFVNAGQPTLAELSWVDSLGYGAPFKIAVLALASRHIRAKSAMVERLGISFVRLHQITEDCIKQGWLTSKGLLTDQGRAILLVAKKLGFYRTEPDWPDPDIFFFLSDVGDHWMP